MKTKMIRVLSALGFVSALLSSVTFGEDGETCVGVEEAMADGNACLTGCNQQFQECTKAVRKATELGDCYECCKKVEEADEAPTNGSIIPVKHPPHDDLHAYMLGKCVHNLKADGKGWNRGFPKDYPSAMAYDPKSGTVDAQIRAKYQNHSGSVPGEIRSPSESACIKGCTHRAREPLRACSDRYSACRAKCPAGTPTACGKR